MIAESFRANRMNYLPDKKSFRDHELNWAMSGYGRLFSVRSAIWEWRKSE
jgi:hypothetical protein